MVRGQAAELAGSKDVDYVYGHKTADLFVAAARMGATAGGGTAAQVERLGTFALHLGLAFQHEDDLLGGDSPLGRAEAERQVREHTDAALAALDGLHGDTSFLASLAARLASPSDWGALSVAADKRGSYLLPCGEFYYNKVPFAKVSISPAVKSCTPRVKYAIMPFRTVFVRKMRNWSCLNYAHFWP